MTGIASCGGGVSSLACGDDGYRERCPADQGGQQAGPNTHRVLDLYVERCQRSGYRSYSFVCTYNQSADISAWRHLLSCLGVRTRLCMVFSFSSATSRASSDHECLASEVCCIHLGQEQCFGRLMTAVGLDCI